MVTIDRPQVRNAVDAATAKRLADAFRSFDADGSARVAVLTGAGSTFCAGYDLTSLARGPAPALDAEGDGPMGPTRMLLSKPVIAALEGYAVAGGLELALWCDLRIAGDGTTLGVFSRRFGVPLIDLGTVRLPRAVGMGAALDLILTGRPVAAEEALRMGLVDRVVPEGKALEAAVALGRQIAAYPQNALRSDRLSAYESWGLDPKDAQRNEFRRGLDVIASGETATGAEGFARGEGRGGAPRPSAG